MSQRLLCLGNRHASLSPNPPSQGHILPPWLQILFLWAQHLLLKAKRPPPGPGCSVSRPDIHPLAGSPEASRRPAPSCAAMQRATAGAPLSSPRGSPSTMLSPQPPGASLPAVGQHQAVSSAQTARGAALQLLAASRDVSARRDPPHPCLLPRTRCPWGQAQTSGHWYQPVVLC